MTNTEIRNTIKNAGVRYWQVADELNISPYTLSVWLRHELDGEKKETILDAIKKCKTVTNV